MVERADDLAAVVRAYFASAAAGDLSAWRAEHLPNVGDLRMVGTDEHEVFVGDAAREHLAGGDGHVTGDLRVEVVALEASRVGSVGWAFARPVIRVGDEPPIELRWTAVFVAREDVWQLVQIHVSRGR